MHVGVGECARQLATKLELRRLEVQRLAELLSLAPSLLALRQILRVPFSLFR